MKSGGGEGPNGLKKVKMDALSNPIIAPSFLFIIKPDKKIINVKTSILGIYANVYPKTIAKAVNVPISEIRKDFLSNHTELLTFSVSIFSALLSITI
jgi:hypothetical protein